MAHRRKGRVFCKPVTCGHKDASGHEPRGKGGGLILHVYVKRRHTPSPPGTRAKRRAQKV